jgi:hypothetical protein
MMLTRRGLIAGSAMLAPKERLGVRSQKLRDSFPSLELAAREMLGDITSDEVLHGGFR